MDAQVIHSRCFSLPAGKAREVAIHPAGKALEVAMKTDENWTQIL